MRLSSSFYFKSRFLTGLFHLLQIQISDWDNHRAKCKQTLQEYLPVKLAGIAKYEMNDMFKGRSHFSVSLHIDMITIDESTRCMVMVGLKDRTFRPIDIGTEIYEEVSAIIKKKGVFNTIGYFYAFYNKEKGLMINTKRIQPPILYKQDKDLFAKHGRENRF